MATAKNKKSTAASEKVKTAATTSVKEESKKASVKAKSEPKKIAAKPEAKKLTTAKELEKIATAKAPEKIAAKPEPKKIAGKETMKLETKENKVVAKAKTVKKTVAPAKKTVKKVEKEPIKKEIKPAVTKAAVKEPVKKEVKPVVTKAAVKEPVKTVAKKVDAKKAEPKKVAVKKAEPKKAEAKKVAPKKTATKKPVKKAGNDKKAEAYGALTIDECIAKLHAMKVLHEYDDYARFLMDEADMKKIEKNIVDGNNLKGTDFSFDKDGYDIDLILVTLQKVAETMDIKAMDYKELKTTMKASVKTKVGEDAEANALEYLKEFKIAEKLLMIGQRKGISDSEELSKLIGSDVDQFAAHFFDLAYHILPGWQYDDVKFYEDFAYAILSQYSDLYDKYQLRILIDVADLYIKHGDFRHGDECYGYILRDNQIKDYIYFRFASVYETIDFNKAKGLAYESLQYVDGRYTYYQDLIDILNK